MRWPEPRNRATTPPTGLVIGGGIDGPSPHSALNSEALRVEGLRVSLGGNDILRGVDFTLAAGKILALYGPSGVGKTTLLRALVGELVPQQGRVLLGSREVTWEPLWKRARLGMGYVPQTPSVLLELSLADNLRTFERALGLGPRPPEAWAEPMGLAARLKVRACDLSGGERRRLELLRALMAEPRVLVCDEPLAGVDPVQAGAIGGLLRKRADEGGMAVIIADHRVREALVFCDEAAPLLDGRLGSRGASSEAGGQEPVVRRYIAY